MITQLTDLNIDLEVGSYAGSQQSQRLETG